MKYINTLFLAAALIYFGVVPSLYSALVVLGCAIVRGIEVWYNAKTNTEMVEKIEAAERRFTEIDQAATARINSFIAAYNGPLARLGMGQPMSQVDDD